MKKIVLSVERGDQGELWGTVNYDDNLLVDNAPTIADLENQMRQLLMDFHDLQPEKVLFNVEFLVSGLFEDKKFLNASEVAKKAKINPSLMRQYVSGHKNPSLERAKQIENAIHEIGKELQTVRIIPKSIKEIAEKKSATSPKRMVKL
jgi:hypothetical protein